jgi:nucleotide-binding universal stress UspA family protein
MAINDLMVQLSSFPEPTPSHVIENSVRIAELLNASIAGAVCFTQYPKASNYLANKLIDADKIIEEENRKSGRAAGELLRLLKKASGTRFSGEHRIACHTSVAAQQLTVLARVYDLTIIPGYRHGDVQFLAETVIFGSGRPVLLLPRDSKRVPSLQTVVIAWDGGRPAARAVADAVPLLQKAGSVHIVSVHGPQELAADQSDGLKRNLLAHGIQITSFEQIEDAGDAADAIVKHCASKGADMLIAGAYGHSRFRDLMLGGVTRSLVAAPPLPVFFSH